VKGDEAARKACGLTIDGREKAVITGVEHVESFDEAQIVLVTHGGQLIITGTGMHVDSLKPEEERMIVSGSIDGAVYSDGARRRSRGFLRQALGR